MNLEKILFETNTNALKFIKKEIEVINALEALGNLKPKKDQLEELIKEKLKELEAIENKIAYKDIETFTRAAKEARKMQY